MLLNHFGRVFCPTSAVELDVSLNRFILTHLKQKSEGHFFTFLNLDL